MIDKKVLDRILFGKIAKYVIVPLAIFVLFKEKIDQLLAVLIVQPFLSYVHKSLPVDLTTFLLCSLTAVYCYSKIIRAGKIPLDWYLCGISFLIVYLTYRFFDNTFIFTSFTFSKTIKLVDFAALVTFGVAIFSILHNRKKPLIVQKKEISFAIDEPISISEDNDLLKRLKFIENLALMITNTNSKNGSFPIGIVSPWGSGKTTFLNSLKKEVIKFDIICIEFNLWMCKSKDQIIETFFDLLKDSLKPYSFSINNKLSAYANDLLNETKSGLLTSFIRTFFSAPNVEKQYEIINSEIKRINKKILVLVDDIDRLDKNEIYEVIRLIRNTANFSNIFFAVAYDRNYILNAIEKINSYQSHIFLEKIFQFEFNLPPIRKNIIQNEVNLRLSEILTNRSMNSYEEFFVKSNNVYQHSRFDLTGKFILNMRDVTRFVNSFHVSYLYLQDEIYFPDFYNLEVVRFKHPEIFIEFFRNTELFLFLGTRKNHYPIKPFTYTLKKIEGQSETKTSKYVLKKYLEDHVDIYKINSIEVDLVVSAFSEIFPEHDRTHKWGTNAHLSVIKPSMLDRYFRLGLDDSLSEIEFSKAREMDGIEFNKKIFHWCQNKTLADELSIRLSEIEDFDSKVDFEKIVSGIFYLGNLPKSIKKNEIYLGLNDYVGYNEESLVTLLGREFVIKSLYNDEKDSYKSFLFSILKIQQLPYNFIHDFVNYLLHRGYYSISHMFSADEISGLLFYYFEFAAMQANKTSELWPHFIRCEKRIEQNKGNTTEISYSINEKTFPVMRRFIFEKDVDGFIRKCLSEVPFENKYSLNNWPKIIFETMENFICLLEGYTGKSIYKNRFIEFYEAQKNLDAKNGLFFDFDES